MRILLRPSTRVFCGLLGILPRSKDVENDLSENAYPDIPMLKTVLMQLRSVLNSLLDHVIKGKQKEAENIIKSNSKLLEPLLVHKGVAVDYSGRIIEGTALQMTLGAEDVNYCEDEECMSEMIQRYLKKLSGGEKIIAIQITEQFPEGWEQQEKENTENDVKVLRKITDAIYKSASGAECEMPIQAFRDYLAIQSKSVKKEGKYFNVPLLIKAFKLYQENHEYFGGERNPKNNTFWCEVIGTIQRYLPACYAQAFCQGLCSIVAAKQKLKRNLKFRYDGIYFYPLNEDSTFRLGYEYAAPLCEDGKGIISGFATHFSKLYQTKNNRIAVMYTAARQLSSNTAVYR